jgi:AAA domain
VKSGSLSDTELTRQVSAAKEAKLQWSRVAQNQHPAKPGGLSVVQEQYEKLLRELDALEHFLFADRLTRLSSAALDELLSRLISDQATLVRLPELHRLESELDASGLGEFLARMKAQSAGESHCLGVFRHAWLRSILEYVELSDLRIGGFSAAEHERTVEEFQNADRDQIETTAARIKRACAESATIARDIFPDQADLVRRQASLKRKHMSVRDMMAAAPDVLLALKPCWAMSPLLVSQLLPARKCFDVVIFDEASQIRPADAITSVLRGEQLIVAGDEKQLPPTAFFVSETAADDDEAEDPDTSALFAGAKDFESILDALSSLLHPRALEWHYRSRDERLIAFSNAHIYDRMLTTFPGAVGGSCVRFVEVPWRSRDETNSPSAEVERVIDLILEHAAEPEESLGVITMGIKHANRIEGALRLRLQDHPELDEFFSEDGRNVFSSRTLSECRATSATRSFSRSVTERIRARHSCIALARLRWRVANVASTSLLLARRDASRSSRLSHPATWIRRN